MQFCVDNKHSKLHCSVSVLSYLWYLVPLCINDAMPQTVEMATMTSMNDVAKSICIIFLIFVYPV